MIENIEVALILLFCAGIVVFFTICAVMDFFRWIRPVSAPIWADSITPIAFEQSCASLLRECGWQAWTTPASGDQGADVIAVKRGVRIVLQCKHYSGPVGNRAVQEAFAAARHHGARVGAVVTNSTYTPAAYALSRSTGVRLLRYHDLARADAVFLS